MRLSTAKRCQAVTMTQAAHDTVINVVPERDNIMSTHDIKMIWYCEYNSSQDRRDSKIFTPDNILGAEDPV